MPGWLLPAVPSLCVLFLYALACFWDNRNARIYKQEQEGREERERIESYLTDEDKEWLWQQHRRVGIPLDSD